MKTLELIELSLLRLLANSNFNVFRFSVKGVPNIEDVTRKIKETATHTSYSTSCTGFHKLPLLTLY